MPRGLLGRIAVLVILVLSVVVLQGPPADASSPLSVPEARPMGLFNWQVRTVDSGPDVGQGASMALAPGAPYTPSMSYYDSPNTALRFATYNGASWITQTVDNTGSTGESSSLALAPAAPYTPSIAYYSYNGVSVTLKYAYFNGSAWISSTVDSANAGTHSALALAPSAPYTPSISYYDWVNKNLKYATGSPAWTVTVVDSAGDVGWYSSVVVDRGNPRISYYDYTNGNLKQAVYSGGWTTEIVDSAGNVGAYTSIAVGSGGWSHISYCQLSLDGESCTAIKYAVDGVSGWISQTVPTGSNDMLYTSLDLDSANRPYIAYYDNRSGKADLMVAFYDGSQWITETVDTDQDAGSYPSIKLDGLNKPRIAYNHITQDAAGTRTLRYAEGVNTCATPLSGVSLQAPTKGITGTNYALTGTLSPGLATSPFTYTWGTPGANIATQVLTGTAIQSAVTRSWSTPGSRTITFTAANCGAVFTATQVIDITACRVPMTGLSLSGPLLTGAGRFDTYTALALPVDSTTPVTYTWQATDIPPLVLTETATFLSGWLTAGTKFITVTAQSCGGVYTATQTVSVVLSSQLPNLTVPLLSRDGASVQYSVRNIGVTAAPPGHAVALYIDNVVKEQVVITTSLAQSEVATGFFATPLQCTGPTCAVKACADAANAVGEVIESNNCRQETWSSDVTPPRFVVAPHLDARSMSTARIAWETDEPTSRYVSYGRTSGSGSVSISDDFATQHVITLTGLLSTTTYQYQVTATDAAGNQATSAELFFQTTGVTNTLVQVIRDSISMEPYDSFFYEFYTLKATTLETANVSHLKFYLDGAYIGTDYSPSPGYEVNLSPYALGYTRDQFYGATPSAGSHTVLVQGYSLSGHLTIVTSTVTAARPPDPYDVDILEPHPSQTVWISRTVGGAAPAGTTLTVTMRAAQFDWGCTWSGFSEGDEVPPGLSAVQCQNVDKAVSSMRLFVDQTLVGVYTPTAAITHTFIVGLLGGSPGTHTLIARGAVNGEFKDSTRDFTIEVGAPSLTLSRDVWREGTYLKVKLTLKNDGAGEALVDKLVDTISGLQQVNQEGTGYDISTSASYWSGAEARRNQVLIDLKSGAKAEVPIAPNASYSVEYLAVPILHEGSVTPSIGGLDVQVTYTYQGQAVVKSFSRPCTQVRDPGGFDVPLAQALADATRESDYVIVTNPTRLYSYYNTSDVNVLLAEMAHLASIKNGVLGYLKTYDNGHILDDLLDKDSHQHWTAALNPKFVNKNEGYVLIVGETEILPSWYVGEASFTTYAGIPDYVYQSDLWYADTGGHTSRPELILGRITGNNANALVKPIQASIGVAEGAAGYDWDRSRALLISGRGDGVSSNFVPTVNIIDGVLNDEFFVTKIHLLDISGGHASYLYAITTTVTEQDVILFRDHGNTNVWGDGLYANEIWGLNFGGHNPFAFAVACKAGNYEQDDTVNMVDQFLWYGAGVYVGSTQISERGTNDYASKYFFRNWPATFSIGHSLNNTKIAAWDDDGPTFDHGKLWAFEYNLYGDPKFGMVGSTVTQLSTAAMAPPPTITFEVHVPDFEVQTIEGEDYVTIPNGSLWLEPGQYQIPYYSVSFDYPKGQRVQAITLTDRSGLVVTAGLSIPVMVPAVDCQGCGPLAPAVTPTATWAISIERKFDWMVEQNPDSGSRLLVRLYPFYYNTETTGVLFYRDYRFDVEVSSTGVEAGSLTTGKPVYVPGEKAAISLLVNNTGAATDVIVRPSIRMRATGDLAGGLPLSTLTAMTGTASLAMEWDTAGYQAGDYTLLVELLDPEGQILDEATRELRLGIVSGQVGSLAAAPTVFNPGQVIDISMVFTNTGTVAVTGTAIILVDLAGVPAPTATLTQTFANLAPGASVQVNRTWNTTGATGRSYRVLGYASYNGTMTDPEAVTVNARSRVYLPLVTRK